MSRLGIQINMENSVEVFTRPVSRYGKPLTEGTKNYFNIADLSKLRDRRTELCRKNVYHLIPPMQREGVDWLCDKLKERVLPKSDSKGDYFYNYRERHHLMKSLMGHETCDANLVDLLLSDHMRVHRYMFQAFPEFPLVRSLAKALLTFTQWPNLGRTRRGWTIAKINEFMDADGFGPALEAAKKYLPQTFRFYGGDSCDHVERSHAPHSGDEVLELLRHLIREWRKFRKYPQFYPDRPCFTENEVKIIHAAKKSSAGSSFIGAHAMAEEIAWDPEADQASPRIPYYTRREILYNSFTPVQHLLRTTFSTLVRNRTTGQETLMTKAAQKIYQVWIHGGKTSRHEGDVAAEAKALEIGWNPEEDQHATKTPYRGIVAARDEDRDDIETLVSRYNRYLNNKRRGTPEANNILFTATEMQVLGWYRRFPRMTERERKDFIREKAREFGWTLEGDANSPRGPWVKPNTPKVEYIRVQPQQTGKVGFRKYGCRRPWVRFEDGSVSVRYSSVWVTIEKVYFDIFAEEGELRDDQLNAASRYVTNYTPDHPEIVIPLYVELHPRGGPSDIAKIRPLVVYLSLVAGPLTTSYSKFSRSPSHQSTQLVLRLLSGVFTQPPHLPIGSNFAKEAMTAEYVKATLLDDNGSNMFWGQLFHETFDKSPQNYYKSMEKNGKDSAVMLCLKFLRLPVTSTRKRVGATLPQCAVDLGEIRAFFSCFTLLYSSSDVLHSGAFAQQRWRKRFACIRRAPPTVRG
jgi:hypothetical protein